MSSTTETTTRPPKGAERVSCPLCGSETGSQCVTSSGRQVAPHRARFDSYARRMRHGTFTVRILTTNDRLGVTAGEQYEAERYWLDPEKVTLLRRIPDGNSPECNQYWRDVEWESW